MKYLFFFFLSCISVAAQAQDFKITGKVVDNETNLPLESATIFVEKIDRQQPRLLYNFQQRGKFCNRRYRQGREAKVDKHI